MKTKTQYTRNVAIVLWNGAEILDWGGPAEVFKAAAAFGSTDDGPAFHVYTVSKTREPIISQGFIEVIPKHAIDDCPKPDILVLPGGGAGSVRQDEAFLAWCKSSALNAEIALSVCTGAFILGDAGLLDGNEATTWYGAIDGLAEAFPKARVQKGRRFIDNGHVVTTAGVSAGIDGSLHVVARLLGKRVADQTAEYMEYAWAPEPYAGAGYPVLNPSLDDYGRRAQLAGIFSSENNFTQAAQTYADLVTDRPEDWDTWLALADCHGALGDHEAAIAAYLTATNSISIRPQAYYKAATAASLLGDANRALEFLEKSGDEAGPDIEAISKDPNFADLRKNSRFEKLVASGVSPT